MRDLIEHYKTLISANLFEGKRRKQRLLNARLKNPSDEGLRDALDVATEKENRRDKAMARKAKASAFIDATRRNPHLSFDALHARSLGTSDLQQKQRIARMATLQNINSKNP